MKMLYIKSEKSCKGYAITQPEATKVAEKKFQTLLVYGFDLKSS